MKTIDNRIDTITTLISSSIISRNGLARNIIIGEFQEIKRCKTVNPKSRKLILSVLHSTRALDSSLKEYCSSQGILLMRNHKRANTLGQYLHQIKSSGKISDSKRRFYQKEIVDERNKYMHEAGLFPNDDNKVFTLISHMHTCISDIL